MARYLVTGAQGFIGRYVSAALLNLCPGSEVLGIGRSPALDDAFSHGLHFANLSRAPLPKQLARSLSTRFTYRQADILDFDLIREIVDLFRPEVVFHLAAGHRHTQSRHIVATNATGTLSITEAISNTTGAKPRLVVASSGGVYGRLDPDHLPVMESSPCVPTNLYAASKLFSEQLALLAGREGGFAVIIARLFNVCGPGQDDLHSVGKFAAQVCLNAPMLRTLALSATRDFIDVRDAARAIAHLGCQIRREAIINVASGVETEMETLVEKIVRLSCFPGKYDAAELKGAEAIPRQFADISQLRATGFTPEIDLETSLADVISYYRSCLSPVPPG
jgi:nucleoside-diphosphate-sugar epimerase